MKGRGNRIVKRKDKEKGGSNLTKGIIFETSDAMAEVFRTGWSYQTRRRRKPRRCHPPRERD